MNSIARYLSETQVALILLVLLFWFVNPLGFWMTDAVHMTLLGLIVALFALFSMLVWKESVEDEREQLHRFISARFAYVTGGLFLLMGTVIQALTHTIDLWLPLTLAGMVLAKIVGRVYARQHC